MYLSRYKKMKRCVVVLVQPLLLMLLVTGSMGNVQVRGFMLDEHGSLRSSAGLCVAQGRLVLSCGLTSARP